MSLATEVKLFLPALMGKVKHKVGHSILDSRTELLPAALKLLPAVLEVPSQQVQEGQAQQAPPSHKFQQRKGLLPVLRQSRSPRAWPNCFYRLSWATSFRQGYASEPFLSLCCLSESASVGKQLVGAAPHL